MTDTADQTASERLGRTVDGQIEQLTRERAALVAALDRIPAIDAELAVLQGYKAQIDPRRPPKPVQQPPAVDDLPGSVAPIDAPPKVVDTRKNVNPTR